jgi:hypothetical protein
VFSRSSKSKQSFESLNDDLEKLFIKSIEDAVKNLSEEDKKKLKKLDAKDRKDLVEKFVTTMSDHYVDTANKIQGARKLRERLYGIGFRRRLRKRWLGYINSYETLAGMSLESIERLRANLGNSKKNEPLLSTLIRLHTRCLRINNEILTLFLNGYGSAALSRWRSLHETAVVMAALSKLGNDGAKAFIAYNAIESLKAMKDFNNYAPALGEKKFTQRQITSAERARDKAVRKYSNQIKEQYGWVSVASGPTINNFRELEKHYGPEHLRPYYRLSSYSIHTNIKTLITGEENKAISDSQILLIGPSDQGFEDALQLSALTTAYSTVTFLTTYPNLENLSAASAITKYERITSESFGLHFDKNKY